MATILITGGNRGIGLSFCKYYRKAGHNVIAVCRTSSPELDHLDCQTIEGIDVSKADDVAKLKSLADQPIDLLINNAGILRNEVLGGIDFSTIEEQFRVNALAPIRVTEALLDRFTPNAKVAMITSRMGSIEDNTSGGRYGYRMSKVALNMASVSMAHDLKNQGIAVGIYHPGLVGTDMIGGFGDITPDEAAMKLADRIAELDITSTGTFWHSNGQALPW